VFPRRTIPQLKLSAHSRNRSDDCPGCSPARLPAAGRAKKVAIQLAACILKLEGATKREDCSGLPAPLARVSRVIREIESEPAAPTDLASFARLARLSLRHFLRTFKSSRA
jgi:hypothetical protein